METGSHDSPTIFTRIIRGEIPCEKIVENENFLAFLDIRPISTGHTLVVPKVQVDQFFHLDTSLLGELLPFAQRIARAQEKAIDCKRVGVMVAGFEVPHAHLHLVPLMKDGDLSFAHAKPSTPEALAEVGAKIRSALS